MSRTDQHESELDKYRPIIITLGKCIICEDDFISQVATPCGHLFSCDKCSDKLKKKCPICRAEISRYYKIYLDRAPVDEKSSSESESSGETSLNSM